MTDPIGSVCRKKNPKGHHAWVNGLEMYYEVHGEGEPLVLLHGALSAIGTSFGKILPAFAKNRKVIAIEQQAHGHTADIDRPLSVGYMAEDTAALLRHIGIGRADFFGYSLGAGIALELAIRHPDLVRKLVMASVAYNREGFHSGLMDGLAKMKVEDMDGTPWQIEYSEISPRPDDWPVLVEKNRQLEMAFRGVSADSVRSIKAPAMILIGDSDIVRPEHAVEMFRLLGGGVAGDMAGLPRSRLAILPGTTHVTMTDRSEWLVPMINEFLEATMPHTDEKGGAFTVMRRTMVKRESQCTSRG